MSSDSLDHLRKYPPETLDATTLRHMRHMARRRLDGNARIRQEIVDKNGEATAKVEWDIHFAQDDADDREAIAMVEAELARRGLEI